MSRSAWQPLNQVNLEKHELGVFIVVARPDGKSWSGILGWKDKNSFTIKNANSKVDLHYSLNPTASFQILPLPKWEIGFGDRRLDL